MGDIITANGTRCYVGPAVASADADTLAEFEALSPWTEIGLIESVGEFGDESAIVTFAAIGDGRVRKSKGARDAGTLALVCAHDPTDTGQAALIDAQTGNSKFAFRIVLPDSPTASHSDTQIYFRALVTSERLNVGTNDNVVRRNFNLAIDSELFVDQATL
jgi:hypothetical protein